MCSYRDETPVRQLHAAIHSHLDALTPTERRIAAFFLEQTKGVALLSVQELAGRLHVGPASIIRVVKKLGYQGLTELKKGLKWNLQRDLSPLEQFSLQLNAGEVAGLSEVTAIARQEVLNVNATMGLLDEVAFRRGGGHPQSGPRRVSRRSRRVAHVAGLAGFVLQHIGLRAFALQHTGLNVSEQLVGAGKDDALLAFSFPPYSPQAIDAAALAKARGASVVSITSQGTAPIASHSDALLVAKADTFGPSNSLSATLVLVHGLRLPYRELPRPVRSADEGRDAHDRQDS